MNYTEFVKDELSKFRLILDECAVSGDAWREYMSIKLNLLKKQFDWVKNPLRKDLALQIQPLIRVRNGKITWDGKEENDFLVKVSAEDFHRWSELGVSDLTTRCLTSSLLFDKKIKVYFPSENDEIFCPSAECVFQQLPEKTILSGLLFEVRLRFGDVRECYDYVLKSHVASVMLYYYSYPDYRIGEREREMPSPVLEDLEVKNVREVNKVREPEKPNKVLRTPQCSR